MGGVLGVVLGLENLPAFWKEPVMEIWDLDFEGTDVSLAKGSAYSFQQALQLIEQNGGQVTEEEVVIPQKPIEVLPLEQNFVNTFPLMRDQKDEWMAKDYDFDFYGNGFVIWGNLVCLRGISADYAARVSKKHVGSEVFALAEENDGELPDELAEVLSVYDTTDIARRKLTAKQRETLRKAKEKMNA